MKKIIICMILVSFVGICHTNGVQMAIFDKMNGFSNVYCEIRHGNYENAVEEWKYMWEFK